MVRFFIPFFVPIGLIAPTPLAAQPVDENAWAAAQIEAGEHSLTGRPGKTRRVQDEKGRVKRRQTERVLTKNEVVYLYPYTASIEAAFRKFGNNPVLIAGSLGDAAKYKARTFTDDNGFFTFRALKPGRYLLMTAVPYTVATTTREDTGRTRTRTTFGYNGWFLDSANSVTEPIYRYTAGRSEFEHPILKVVDVRTGSAITNLGEVE